MKILVATLVILFAITGCADRESAVRIAAIQAKLDWLEKISVDADRYAFHYVGKEIYANEFSIYRLDKKTGAIERFVAQIADEKSESGIPPHSLVKRLNLVTGESDEAIDSLNREIVRLWFERESKKQRP